MELLTAKSNDKIKEAVSVRDSAKVRREMGSFFLEGARLCSDAASNGVKIERSFVTDGAIKKYPEYINMIVASSNEVYEISEDIAARLSDTRTTQGVFCICKQKNSKASIDNINVNGKYVLLENVQDPSNLGAVSRTAEALGIDGIIIGGGCDIYNPKALRASMGSALRISIMSTENIPQLLTKCKKSGMLTLASTPDSNSRKITSFEFDKGTICVVGNEGNGVTEETMSACEYKVTVPMTGRAESLNAATAAAILIWEMVRK